MKRTYQPSVLAWQTPPRLSLFTYIVGGRRVICTPRQG